MLKLLQMILVSGTVVLGLSGCSNLPGVNVGASVPIGGIGSIGVGTTVGEGKRGAPSPPPSPSSEPSDDESQETQ